MNSKIKLGVNIDHVATIRNARGTIYPSPLRAAILAQQAKADSITIHIREDRRHIRERDLIQIKNRLKIPVNLEMAPTPSMLHIALKHKPDYVCIVPEKRQELTTEGGLNVVKYFFILKKIINKLKDKNIRVSLFLEPNKKSISAAAELEVDCVEIHTGKLCNLVENKKKYSKELNRISSVLKYGFQNGLEMHVGHGITYNSLRLFKNNKYLSEVNIGHFIISESIFLGIKKAIKNIRRILI
tara:strand:- start:395 stop:1120 length:726 start_codon:yes stop_codon:yes gene_type:complete